MHPKIALILPSRKLCGGVESVTSEIYADLDFNHVECDIIFLSDISEIQHPIQLFVKPKELKRFRSLLNSYSAIVVSGEYIAIASEYKGTIYHIIHGNPLVYVLSFWPKASHLLRGVLDLAILTIFKIHANNHITIYSSKHVAKSLSCSITKATHSTGTPVSSARYLQCTKAFPGYNDPPGKCVNTNGYFLSICSPNYFYKGIDRLEDLSRAGLSIKLLSSFNSTSMHTISPTEDPCTLKELYLKSIGFIHLSRYEGCPIVVLDAILFSKPVVIVESPWANDLADNFKCLVIPKSMFRRRLYRQIISLVDEYVSSWSDSDSIDNLNRLSKLDTMSSIISRSILS